MDTNNLQKIITDFRQTKDERTLDAFACDIVLAEHGYWSFDRNSWPRAQLIMALFHNSEPEDKPLIKWLLKQEHLAQEVEMPYYALDAVTYLLYKYMEMEDLFAIYHSKFETYGDIYLEVELTFGFDKEETKTYLRDPANKHPYTEDYLKTIARYESNTQAKYKTRAELMEYYEYRKIVPITNDLEFSEEFMKTGISEYSKILDKEKKEQLKNENRDR